MKILFVNHSASYTGAPMVLLRFIEWLKKHNDCSIDVLSLKTGKLLEDFTKVADSHYFDDYSDTLLRRTGRVIKKRLSQSEEAQLKYSERKLKGISNNKYDIIYANTVVSIPVAVFIKKKSKVKPKLIVHFHELNLTIQELCRRLDQYSSAIDHGIAVSNKVKDNLIQNWGFDNETLSVVYPFSEVKNVPLKSDKSFIVGGSGLAYWRKGPEYFMLVAKYVLSKLPDANIKFHWVGKVTTLNDLIYSSDLERLDLTGKFEFTGLKKNPIPNYANFDVFLMTSKEDPFPLVCIELGMMGKPIVCFENATGTEEVLKSVEGAVVPYLDIAAMGDRVIAYYENEALKRAHGEHMASIFSEFTSENQCRQLFKVLSTQMD